MIRRLSIVQALLNDPKILILDEPSTGLDIKKRVRLRNTISKLSKDGIIILSTHIVSDIDYITTAILVLRKGMVIVRGNREQVISTIVIRQVSPTLEFFIYLSVRRKIMMFHLTIMEFKKYGIGYPRSLAL